MESSSDSARHGSADKQSPSYPRTLDCVHCGLCLPVCPTHQVLGIEAESPRGRIYLMRALAEGRVEDPEAIRPHLDRCLDCRACETACPSGVKYGEILESTRAELEQRRPKRGIAAWLTRTMLWHVVAKQGRLRLMFWGLRLAESMGLRWLATKLRLLPRQMAELAPPVPPGRDRRPLPTGLHVPPAGVARRNLRVALFTGCVMEPMFGRVNRATLDVLLQNGFDVHVPKAQRCCGALLMHAGRPDRAKLLARENVAAFADDDIVINNSAGCGCALKEYDHLLGDEAGQEFAKKCRDVSEVLAEHGLTATPAERRERVVYDDPCHLCHGQGVRSQPRELLQQVPGIELVATSTSEDCCGSAGIYNMLQPELAGEIGQRKVANLVAAAPDLIVTGNPGCMLQIDSHLRRSGHKVPVRHPIELLRPPPPSASPPLLSQ
ncbi:MAG: (Fe-S)-binding protein [Planctomycetota bacterium]